MTSQQKWLVLGGLLVAWGGVTLFQLSNSSEGHLAGSSIAETPLPPIKDLTLETAFSNPRQTAKFSTPRNIFAPLGSQQKIEQQKQNLASIPRQTETAPSPPPPPPGPSAAELAEQRARQQLNQFRFLGYLTKGGESQAFLTNGQAIYIIKQGEMLEGRVQVNKIEPETVVLSTRVWETGNHVQATIPLTPDNRG